MARIFSLSSSTAFRAEGLGVLRLGGLACRRWRGPPQVPSRRAAVNAASSPFSNERRSGAGHSPCPPPPRAARTECCGRLGLGSRTRSIKCCSQFLVRRAPRAASSGPAFRLRLSSAAAASVARMAANSAASLSTSAVCRAAASSASSFDSASRRTAASSATLSSSHCLRSVRAPPRPPRVQYARPPRPQPASPPLRASLPHRTRATRAHPPHRGPVAAHTGAPAGAILWTVVVLFATPPGLLPRLSRVGKLGGERGGAGTEPALVDLPPAPRAAAAAPAACSRRDWRGARTVAGRVGSGRRVVTGERGAGGLPSLVSALSSFASRVVGDV